MLAMKRLLSRSLVPLHWILAWLAVSVVGACVMAYLAIERQRDLFETDARIVHRLLSQRVVQHEAILATLLILQSEQSGTSQRADTASEQRLSALYPHIKAVQRRDHDAVWPDARLAQAEAKSRQLQKTVLASVEATHGRYSLVSGALNSAYALTIDMRAMVPWDDWPMQAKTSPVKVHLAHEGQSFELQAGSLAPAAWLPGWSFDFRKRLAADSQPFYVVAHQTFGWSQLPWAFMLLWSSVVGVVLYAIATLMRQRNARRRAEELLRLGQVVRLNTMGELAAGVAHELNQPLTAVLANTQAAQRMLNEATPDLTLAQVAMTQAVAQAGRASQVLGRLRRMMEQPGSGAPLKTVNLGEAVQRALYLLEPELQRLDVQIDSQTDLAVLVHADPVGIDQIVHNLLTNALQALEKSDQRPRRLQLVTTLRDKWGVLSVADNGPGIAPDVLPHLFEPFFSTRQGGLGLGLTLCETLTLAMHGQLQAYRPPEGGALFVLSLPLAQVKREAAVP
jgi:signal transduction histidine kinase